MAEQKITVAQLRGNGLSDRETKTWEFFPSDIVQTVFTTHKNIYAQSPLPFPLVKVRSSADNFFTKNFYKYFFGQYQHMFGLEKHLADFAIAHVGELYNYYTYQAVQAKKNNKKLKVVATVWENSFGRFEYNYWPGFKIPPRYWREHLAEIMQANVRGVDMFLPTTSDAAELLKDYGVPDEKITIVAPGIIPAKAGDFKLPSELVGKELYLMVNRLVKEKGVYDVLYAWRRYLRLTKSAVPKTLVIVGDGPERGNMMRLVTEWGLTSSVFFIRQLPYQEVLGLYREGKCLLLGSIPQSAWQEQFGYVLAEAMCVNTPIIATYCGGIPDVVGSAGLLVPPAHPIAFSNALLEIDNKEAYHKIKAGCAIENKKFAIEKFAETMARVYRDVAQS